MWWLEQPGAHVVGAAALVIGVCFIGLGMWRFMTIKAGINEE
jgi:hypothetical protein